MQSSTFRRWKVFRFYFFLMMKSRWKRNFSFHVNFWRQRTCRRHLIVLYRSLLQLYDVKWKAAKRECNIYDSYASTLRSEIILIINAVRQCDKTITSHKATIELLPLFLLRLFALPNPTTIFIADDKEFSFYPLSRFHLLFKRHFSYDTTEGKHCGIISFLVASVCYMTFNLEKRFLFLCFAFSLVGIGNETFK